jgi:hypothetical protein
MLSPDAAIALGLAATAMPFADSPEAEADRWLRILRLHGRAGRALTALGVGEAPLADHGEHLFSRQARTGRDVSERVTEQAARIANDRNAETVGTTDVLLAVMQIYGPCFDRVLHAYGTNHDEVVERLATGPAAASSSV